MFASCNSSFLQWTKLLHTDPQQRHRKATGHAADSILVAHSTTLLNTTVIATHSSMTMIACSMLLMFTRQYAS